MHLFQSFSKAKKLHTIPYGSDEKEKKTNREQKAESGGLRCSERRDLHIVGTPGRTLICIYQLYVLPVEICTLPGISPNYT